MATFTIETALRVIDHIGGLPLIGQVPASVQRELDRLVRSGELFKYRGYWDTLSPVYGMGPLKTIYARIPSQEAA